ncbi:MAG: hypothetical protein V3R67_07930 [Thermodesulfobacteriota bacterium]
MAIKQIPLNFDVPSFQFKVDLDGIPFSFDFEFNDRLQKWSFNILDDAGTCLLVGILFTVNGLFLEKFQYDTRLPQGDLFAINTVNDEVDPDRDNLGTDVVFLYDEAL